MVVFNLAIFVTFDDDSYSVQVPRHCRKNVYAHKFDSKILFVYISHFPVVFVPR